MAVRSDATYFDWQQWPEEWMAQDKIDREVGEFDTGRTFAGGGNLWLEGGAKWLESGSPVMKGTASNQDGSESLTVVDGSPMYWQFSGYEAAPYTSLDILIGPSLQAAFSGHRLTPGDTFVVDRLVEGELLSGVVFFLRLADGRGWVYDRLPTYGFLCNRIRANRIVLPRSPSAQQVLASDWLNSAALETHDPAPKSTPQDRGDALDNPRSGLTRTRRRNQQRAMRRIAIKKLNGKLSPQGGEVRRESSGSEPEVEVEMSYWQFIGYEGSRSSSSNRLPFFTGPSRKAAASDHELSPGDTFAVDKVKACELSVCSGMVLFLRLADGRGWVCDRSPKHGIVCVRVEADSIGLLQGPLARRSTASDWLTLAAAGAKAFGQRSSAPKLLPQDCLDSTLSSSVFTPGSLSRLGQDQPIDAPSMTSEPALPTPSDDVTTEPPQAEEAAQWPQSSWADDYGPVAEISCCDWSMLPAGTPTSVSVADNLLKDSDIRCTLTQLQ